MDIVAGVTPVVIGSGSGANNPNTIDDHLEASHVYALLTDRYRISRNIRVEWFLENLNRFFPPLSPNNSLNDFQNEIDIISFVTSNQSDNEQLHNEPLQNDSKFFISCNTKFTFFSRKYCFVYVLDMSTSVANVDIQHSTILTDELYDALAKCLQNIIKPFYVPGSRFLFEPEFYVTIIAYLPFYSLDTNNVIVHGYKLSTKNIVQLLSTVREKIYYYIELLYQNIKSDHFLDVYGHRTGKTIVPANLSLINMIRFGLLSLNLLPENSHQGIIIVTDGNTGFSDAYTLESALAQLRLCMISCSFIHIGSPSHPDSSLGYVPYNDFMNFIAQATFGAYISISSDYDCDFETNCFNIFHRAFFVYSFNHGSSSFSKCLRENRSTIWAIDNPYFYSNQDEDTFRCRKKDQQLLRRKQLESQINASFAQILSYRLREGFTIKRVNLIQNENIIEIALTLPWRHNVNIEYHISAYFQRNGTEEEDFNFTSYEVIVESNYCFLHDASCQKKVFKSPLRATTIKQFLNALKHFNDSDNLGIHFHYFAKNEMYRSIPESIKNGVSLFYLPPSSNVPVVSVPNEAHMKFAQYWKPICMLDVNMCQKSSLHTHQINVLLKHDSPLPEYLYQPNSFGRYETIQCKQTMSVLNVVLKEWSSFVLLENHSYIKLIKEKENKSCSFYLIRIIAQPPCLVLHLAFIGGTSGSLRNQIVNDLSQKLKQCKLPQRNLSSSLMQKTATSVANHHHHHHTTNITDNDENDNPSNESTGSEDINDGFDSQESNEDDDELEASMNANEPSMSNNGSSQNTTTGFITLSSHKRNSSNNSSVNCFVILNRPIERMLIRYEKIPKDFFSCYKYEEDWRSKNCLISYASLNMFQTLVRFLYHQRFIWCTQDTSMMSMTSKSSSNHLSNNNVQCHLNSSSVSKILSTLTLKRIQEGFTLAYNECGVVNLVKEFWMKDYRNDNGNNNGGDNGTDDGQTMFPCLVQYIIFPSNVIIKDDHSNGNSPLNGDYDDVEDNEDDQDDGVEEGVMVEDCNDYDYEDHAGDLDDNKIGDSQVNNNQIKPPTSPSASLSDYCYQGSCHHHHNHNHHHHRHHHHHHRQNHRSKLDGHTKPLPSSSATTTINKHLIVTECWIEPQNGRSSSILSSTPPLMASGGTTVNSSDNNENQKNENNSNNDPTAQRQQRKRSEQELTFDQIPSSFYERDLELVSVLLTYEYLVSYDPKCHYHVGSIDHCGQQTKTLLKPVPETIQADSCLNDSEATVVNNERFKHIPFKFNLLNILDKSQQALIKFSSLYQLFNFNVDDGRKQSWNNCTNIMLYSEFVHKISQFHDEIYFNHEQTICFIKKTNERLAQHYSTTDTETSSLFNYIDDLQQDLSISFRCFSKKISGDCIILTLLPSSYKVVRKLIFVDYLMNKINKNLIGNLEERGHNCCYGSLIIPVIVHKLTFNSLTNILLNNYKPTNEHLCPNWDLLFDFSKGNEQFYSNQTTVSNSVDTYSQTEEISLENFAKSLETLFRNSFTDAIYKSLRYGFEADEHDVKLVLEKICYKTIDYVDITDFLIYTCKHMKPVIHKYFERYPHNSIFDLLTYIAGIGYEINSNNNNSSSSSELSTTMNNEQTHLTSSSLPQGQSSPPQRDLLSLKFSSPTMTDNQQCCCDHTETLKTDFVNLIQSHFSSIPTPSNSYYFYNYENIQKKNYTFGEVDAKKKKENLVDFYEKIENNEIDLTQFYDEIKNTTKFLYQDHMKDEHLSVEDEFTNTIDMMDVDGQNDQDKGQDTNTVVNMDDFQSLILTRPFFVGFFYSLTLKNGTQVRKISTIPTCLLDIISPSQNMIELENFRVFLNIEIITQNVEPQKVSSNSSVISGGGGSDGQIILMANNAAMNDGGVDHGTVSLNKLLDEFQVYKYIEFFHRIKWMIRDEIVSISHSLFQICPRTLDMVVEHIKHTKTSNTSFIEKVEMKFVFPLDDNSNFIDEFRDELSRLRFSNYRLCELGRYFYVVHDARQQQLSSLSTIATSASRTMLFTTFNQKETDDGNNDGQMVFNEELFDPPKESLIAEYTMEESMSNFSPNFWLIMELEFDETRANFVSLYFHSRPKIYLYGSEILCQLKKCLEFSCKKFNQKFLLARLFETRICDDLLISKEDPDPFIKNTVRSTLNSTPISNFWDSSINSNYDLDYDSFDNISSLKILRTNFMSGSFQCDIVWDKHFPLHRRLHSYQSKEGFNTIRSVLNSFLVSNRNNLYVFSEKSDAVFYMRIYEIECNQDSFSDNFQTINHLESPLDVEMNNYFNDNVILTTTATTTVPNNQQTSTNEDEQNKCDSDNDSVNSLNVNRTSNVQQQCILMNVHGIVDPSKEIKEDMVAALQRKLDEALLDLLILMLARNPLSKLSSQDVSFIQGRNSVLKNYHFIINECYYPFITNIKGYIRQNLSTFLNNPKYLDRNPECHFKLFKNGQFHCVKDEDVFLYHCQEESGKDTKGIACIIFSIMSKEKLPELTPSTFNVNQLDINDFVSGYFDYIVTVCSPQTIPKEHLNLKFGINFQVWYAGKIDMNYLCQKLKTAICHSLWEFNLEFKILKLCTYEDSLNVNSISEPSTPKKIIEKRERRTGLSSVTLKPPMLQIDDKMFNKGYDKYGQASSSTIIETVGQENYFDFTNIEGRQSGSPHDPSLMMMSTFRELKNKELICLSHFLKAAIKPWLDYGKQISVTSISRHEFPLIMRKSIFTIVREFKEYIGKFSSDMKMNFLMSSGQQYYEFDCNTKFDLQNDDDGNSYMILLRHESLWKTKFLHQAENSFVQNFFLGKCDANKFEFAPCFYNSTTKSIHDSNLALNTSNEIKQAEPEAVRCLSPRQKFLLLFIEDQNLTLYLYNWNSNINNGIVAWFSNMVLWHNARSLLLQSLILQKAGLFHNSPFKRYTPDKLMNISNVAYKNTQSQSYMAKSNMSNINSDIFLNVDLLLKYENPYRAYNENKDQLQNKTDFVFDTKNYDYIFSDFNENQLQQNQDLFDCFRGQFNSNVNVYIRDLKDLSKVWQLHGTKLNYPTVQLDKIIQHIKSYGRLSHYCLTPFLFSHKWRFVVSVIRDHTLPLQTPRVRHMSGGNILKQPNNEHELMFNVKQRSRRKSGPPNMLEHSMMLSGRTASDESLDKAVCPHYIQEYVQYLQSLGFSSIKSQKVIGSRRNLDFDRQLQPTPPPRYDYHQYNYANNKYKIPGAKLSASSQIVSGTMAMGRKTSQYGNKNEYEKFYLIKTVVGGFYLLEVGFCEPFVYSYLYSFDSKRFVSWTKNNSNNSNITNFLDELDSIMVRMHLHSFTYDYHLRAIHSYISGRQLLQRGYHLISFLDDFLKYYQKAPNYARNHVYSDNLVFESQQITADQLFNYIIKHNQDYGVNVFTMNSTLSFDQVTGMNEEYVLIHLSSHRIPFMDENDIQQEDNFDVALLVAYQKMNNARILKPKQLCLRFYLLLTSQRELFPKLYSFRNKGVSRTIRMLSTSFYQPTNNQQNENNATSMKTDCETNTNKPLFIRNHSDENHQTDFRSIDRNTYSGICDEKINYLGYFNAHEIVMLNILDQKVNETRQFLEAIIKAAEIDCRRDFLWESLTGSGSPSLSPNMNDVQLSMEDFNELLGLVKSIRLDEYDSNLIQFNAFNYNWYRSLAQKLELKFEFSCRKFFKKDGSLKMALFKTNCKDCFIMFNLKNTSPCLVEFRIVFNKPPSIQIDQLFLKRCDPQYHALVEDFVNACTSHMWCIMLS